MTTNLTTLETALNTFTQLDLRTAATNLLTALGYSSRRVIRLDDLTADGFKEKFELTPDQFNDEKALTSQWDQFEFLFQLSDSEVRRTLTLFNQVDPGEKNSFYFHALALKPRLKPYTRTELANITRQLNRPFDVPTVVLIHYADYLTLGVIARRTHKRDATRDVLEKVTLIKDISLTRPHTAHIRILNGLSVAGLPAQNFDEVLKCWQTTLNIRELNERFYKELSAWYYIATSRIKLPVRSVYHQSDAENVQHFTLRLICRTLFCWFLKEKGLIDSRLLELYDGRDLPTDLLPGVAEVDFEDKNSYYRGVLQNVFFACLNQPMGTSRAKQYLGKRYLPADFDFTLFGRIPYLNGGLFDKLEEDNASDTTEDSPKFQVTNELFYARSLTAGSGRNTLRTQGLNRILSSYKFTVDENTSLEEDVALDPELLGMVFENLLAETDPDENTAKTARKASGSFYTPRRVIDYMVNESLVLYLTTYAGRQGITDPQTRQHVATLVYENHAPAPTDPTFNDWIIDALDDLKMLDPACGSGAFPMGMLNRIVALLKVVDSGNGRWIEKQVARLPAELRDQTRRELTRHDQDYARKLGLIRNAIYGVDILPMASVLTKLRFFISLLIDQRIDLAATGSNYNISPLPNLETKIICADTLTDVIPSVFDQSTIDRIEQARERYYGQQRTTAEKTAIATELAEHLDTLYNYEQFGQKISRTNYTDPATKRQANRELLREWFQHGNLTAPFFNVSAFFPELRGRGFDLVIGNPPYGGNPVSDGVKTTLVLGSKDPYGAFMARFLADGQRATPLREGGVLAFIVSDTFMTIKSHLPLRKQLLNHRLHKMIRVHPDTFNATVNTAIVLAQKVETRPRETPAPLTDGHEVLMADLTNVSIHDHYDRFLNLLNQTGLGSVAYGQATLPKTVSTPDYAIYQYPQRLITTNNNLPLFVASPKLFALMNDTTAPRQDATIGNQTVQARLIRLNGKDVPVVKLGQIAEVKQGLATGDNDAYLFQNPAARGTYRSIDDYQQFLLTDADLTRIQADNALRLSVIEHGISKDDQRSDRYFGGRYILPYDKGGESDSDNGWLPNYYVTTAYFIDWSEWAVDRLKTLTTEDRNSYYGKDGGDDGLCSRFQNTTTYFKSGITYSPTGAYAPTFRVHEPSVYDKEGSCVFLNTTDDETIIYSVLANLTNRMTKYFQKHFINGTVHSMMLDVAENPMIINLNLHHFVAQIVSKQKANPRYDYASHEQIEIDQLVYEAYGLNADDIQEVETWYARRYPKLAGAQARNRAALAQPGNTSPGGAQSV